MPLRLLSCLLWGLFVSVWGIAWTQGFPPTWYVDDNAHLDPGPGDPGISNPLENGSQAHPFDSIQEAINNSAHGTTIVVLTGTYKEAVYFGNRNITLTSSAPEDPAIVAGTILDGEDRYTPVIFGGAESSACVLAGFTIKNANGDYSGGGIEGHQTRATIRRCVLDSNRAESGGGISGCDGLISNCIFINNYGRENGGGLSACDGLIDNCIIRGNSSVHGAGGIDGGSGEIRDCLIENNESFIGDGGGLSACSGLILRCTIRNNNAWYSGGGLGFCHGLVLDSIIDNNFAGGGGGGIAACSGIFRNCMITNNETSPIDLWNGGGGAFQCNASFANCTIANNHAEANDFGGGSNFGNSGRGGGFYRCTGAITNCIYWGNVADIAGDALYDSSMPTYSCIQDWTSGGEGNFADDPLFVNATAKDFHLRATSPCIDRGKSLPENFYDFEGDIRIPRWDIGADEYVRQRAYAKSWQQYAR